jgi:hypothetical protein
MTPADSRCGLAIPADTDTRLRRYSPRAQDLRERKYQFWSQRTQASRGRIIVECGWEWRSRDSITAPARSRAPARAGPSARAGVMVRTHLDALQGIRPGARVGRHTPFDRTAGERQTDERQTGGHRALEIPSQRAFRSCAGSSRPVDLTGGLYGLLIRDAESRRRYPALPRKSRSHSVVTSEE